jgi:hypothetical protein
MPNIWLIFCRVDGRIKQRKLSAEESMLIEGTTVAWPFNDCLETELLVNVGIENLRLVAKHATNLVLAMQRRNGLAAFNLR